MKIISAEFVKGVVGSDAILNDGVPQIAFVGRSNAGKSSLINSLINKKDLVRTGKKPGKTTEINFFKINGKFYFVDLPGYGYAKAGMEERERIRKLILWYLEKPETKPSIVVLILDIKAGFSALDREMVEILREYNHHYIIVANKIDKLGQKDIARCLDRIKKDYGEEDIVLCSAKTKKGIDVLIGKLF